MTEENVRQVMSMVSEKVPEDKLMFLRNKLATLPDSKVDEIICMKFYDSTTILLFSIFLGGFGVDRFVIGDTGLGVAKLLLGTFTCGIWPLVDIFFSYKRAKEKNLNKIMMMV